MDNTEPKPSKKSKKASKPKLPSDIYKVDHSGHRARIKKRFHKWGLDNFECHEILEMILYYAIPQRDTNGLAHVLLNRFDSFVGVLDAPIEELMQVKGVSEHTAVLIKLFPAMTRRYLLEKAQPVSCYDTLEKVGTYACTLLVDATVEKVYMLLFDNRMRLMDTILVATGSVNNAPVLLRVVIETALLRHASAVILVHNHPNGVAIPSGEDVSLTHQLEAACNLVGLQFLDHLVVSGDCYMPILRQQKGASRSSPFDGIIHRHFYRGFYGMSGEDKDKPST